VFITGEAGSGKSTLLENFLLSLDKRGAEIQISRGQCIEHNGAGEAYLPVLEALGRLLRNSGDEQQINLLRRVAPTWLLQWPSLLEPADHARLKRQTAGAQNDRMLREMAEGLDLLAAERPLILLLEDLHWSDVSTLDLLTMVAQRRERAKLLILCSFRPVDAIVSIHPIRTMSQTLVTRGQASELLLGYLRSEDVALYLTRRFDHQPPSATTLSRLYERSAGHPLYLTQLSDYLIQSGITALTELPSDLDNALPPGLRDLIDLQLTQLPDTQLQLLEVASLCGMEFAAASVAVGMKLPIEEIERHCEYLAQQGRFIQSHGLAIWPDGTASGEYQFRHALYENVLRHRIAESRSARLQRQIAEHLEQAYGARSPEIATQLTQHYEAGGLKLKAALYGMHGARAALQRFDTAQALAQAERSLKLLSTVNHDPGNDVLDATLNLLSIHALHARHGYMHSEIAHHLQRVEQLLLHIEDPGLLETALGTLWLSYHMRAEFHQALKYAEETQELGVLMRKQSLECMGLAWRSLSLQMLGQYSAADRFSQQAMRHISDASQHTEGSEYSWIATTLTSSALIRWLFGQPDLALQQAQQALDHYHAIGNPYLACLTRMVMLNIVLVYRRDYAALQESCERLIPLCERIGARDALLGARIQIAISRCFTGYADTGLPQLRQALAEQSTFGLFNLVFGYVHEAQCCMQLGRLDEARNAVRLAAQIVENHNMRGWESEVLRTDGELLLLEHPKKTAGGEARLLEALTMTRDRRALSLELRTAMSLARHWHRQKKTTQALDLLQPIYARFTEGFDTPDLMDAKQLMQTLGG
jgi:tetratricopeptide (TPR) repeat protein